MQGKKTYITAAIAIIGAISAYLSGQAELGPTIQIAVTALLAVFVRDGVNSSAKKVEDQSKGFSTELIRNFARYVDDAKPKQNRVPKGKYDRSPKSSPSYAPSHGPKSNYSPRQR